MKPTPEIQIQLRALPSVQELLQHPQVQHLEIAAVPLTQIVKEELESLRKTILAAKFTQHDSVQILVKNICLRGNALLRPSLQRVVNASGIILHTNMGRAPLADTAREAVMEATENYSNIEIDLSSGKRGNRQDHCEELLKLLTGAEAAMVVNNCAAATLLALSAICRRKEVPVSRGELVEIGGSFRMPDVMKFSGAKMVEIGTTNKTHLQDYAEAVNEKTAAILKVHYSNYRIVGFTKEVSIAELGELAQQKQVPLIYDMGSGMLEDMQHLGYPYEPTAREILDAGVDVLLFSGDKILGGSQSGIVVGKKRYINKLRKFHLARALRCDKMTLAALEATLRLYLQPEQLTHTLPVAQMLALNVESLRSRAENIVAQLVDCTVSVEVTEATSQIGSGAFPLETLPSIALQLSGPLSPLKLQTKLRDSQVPIIGYVQDDVLLLNLRTVRDDEDELILQALQSLLPKS
ncbi:MAG: L-seryl-tRNA(Sec) selenium transferase [Calditrichia bacterium]